MITILLMTWGHIGAPGVQVQDFRGVVSFRCDWRPDVCNLGSWTVGHWRCALHSVLSVCTKAVKLRIQTSGRTMCGLKFLALSIQFPGTAGRD